MTYTIKTFFDAIENDKVDLTLARIMASTVDIDPLILIMSNNVIIENIYKIDYAEAERLLGINLSLLIPLCNQNVNTDNSLHLFLFIWCQSLRVQLMYFKPELYNIEHIIEACIQLENCSEVLSSKKALNFILISMHIHAICFEKLKLYAKACEAYIRLFDKAVVAYMPSWSTLVIEPIIMNAIVVYKSYLLEDIKNTKLKEYFKIINKYLKLHSPNANIYNKYIRCITKVSTYNFFKTALDISDIDRIRKLCTVNQLAIDRILLSELEGLYLLDRHSD